MASTQGQQLRARRQQRMLAINSPTNLESHSACGVHEDYHQEGTAPGHNPIIMFLDLCG
jgi:hypothetical protein